MVFVCLGIDKPNVRWVFLYKSPFSIEDLGNPHQLMLPRHVCIEVTIHLLHTVQMVGRAGRDGKEADGVVWRTKTDRGSFARVVLRDLKGLVRRHADARWQELNHALNAGNVGDWIK